MIVRRMFFVFMLFAAAFAYSQEARRSLYLSEFDGDSSFSEEQQQVIRESLLLRMQNEVESVDFILDRRLESAGELDSFQRAVLNGADSVLEVRFSGEMQDLSADFTLFDALLGSEISRFRVNGEVDPQYRNLFAGFWYEAIQELDARLNPITDSARLRIIAQEGSNLRIPFANPDGSELKLDIGAEGFAIVELAVPASYSIFAEKSGYFPEETELFLQNSAQIDLSSRQEPLDVMYLYAGLHMISFPRFGAGVLLLQDRLRLGLDVVAYQLGIQAYDSGDRRDGDDALLVSIPLLSAGVQAGLRLDILPWPLDIQPVLDLNGSIRILTEESWLVDPLFPLEIRLENGLVWRIGRHSELNVALAFPFLVLFDPQLSEFLTRGGGSNVIPLSQLLYLSPPFLTLGMRFGL